ncbi:hypothetical protein [Pseudomonas oryzihabitans]|uniref:phage tail fiber protein n=1 Tax=Pseudomonas oryzihabitans TaxID=47885 RepID=UPI002895EAA5|nr:hypothetical protein [Pseudomonas oryzihabitans]MDT3721407.1 hypothetical protein [Pseudomonas oryzihabitans]
MANLTEQNQYEDGIYQIEKSDPVVGGADGISNRQANQLANRTRWLKARLDGLLDSPALTGKPTAPRPAPGTTSDQLQTAAGVLAQLAAFGVGTESVSGLNLDLNQAGLGITVRYEGTQSKAVAQNYPRVTGSDSALVAFDVITHGSATRTVQLATEIFGTSGTRARSFMRVRHDSTWFDWRELAMADTLAKVATGGRFADLPTEIAHWLAGKSAAKGLKVVYLQNQEETGNVALEMANSGGYTVCSLQAVQDGNGGWAHWLSYTPPGEATKDRRVGWLGISTGGEVKIGSATLPAGRTGQLLSSEGDQSVNGTKRFSGEVQTTNSNSWRHVNGDYGYFWRHDGAALYLLLTAKGDAYGSWNDLRPFAVNLTTGRVAISSGLETLTPITNDSSNNAANTAWVQTEMARKKAMYRFQNSGTWTCPAGVTKVWISGCGGGGGGGGAAGYDGNNVSGTGAGAGGGAGNSVVRTPIDVVPGTSYAITIGGGGSGGLTGAVASTGGQGTAGGSTAFGNLLTLAGGASGAPGNVSYGAGGIATGIGATSGGDGQTVNKGGNGGSGGSGPFGTGGGGGRAGNANGQPGGNAAGFGTGGGGGGGGYAGTSGTGGAGGAGMPGLLIIEH